MGLARLAHRVRAAVDYLGSALHRVIYGVEHSLVENLIVGEVRYKLHGLLVLYLLHIFKDKTGLWDFEAQLVHKCEALEVVEVGQIFCLKELVVIVYFVLSLVYLIVFGQDLVEILLSQRKHILNYLLHGVFAVYTRYR